ncbi:MAG: topoisomerase C-terminal repeat-containing protein, partial [Myxococcales bacterium]|nr:topoisomerase C-terminal repeat-containing protein [Myxococcales bacterium]
QTPTLAMIVRRDQQIAAFVPETFWQVKATFEPVPEGSRFTATFFRPEIEEPKTSAQERPSQDDDAHKEVSHAERLDEPTAQAVAEAARDRPARVDRAERRSTRERPPLLYDLTSLQRRANQRYGLSAQRTLDIAQALYERHKLITYPRTDARYLLPDQVPELPAVLTGLRPVPPYTACVDDLLSRPIAPGPRVVNPAEVGDHPAILPTGRTPSSALDPDEKRVFDLVARRLLAALSADALFDVTKLVVAIDLPEPVAGLAPPLRFRTRGRVCRQQGWRAIDPPGKQVDLELPAVEEADPLLTVGTESVEGVTRPPRPHNDASLLRSMETAGRELDDEALARVMRGCGLGTPATRAAILQVLLDRKYAERRGKDLRATPAGIALIEAIPVDALKSAELTAEWEGRLTQVAEARDRRDAFMHDVSTHLAGIVTALRGAELRVAAFDGPVIGACPACGGQVRERPRRYACDNVGTCRFEVSTRIAKRAISGRMVKQLLTTGRAAPVKGFKSKAGKDFEAGLRWDAEQRKVVFWFEDRPRRTAEPAAPTIGEGAVCPACGEGTVIRGRSALGCSRWREGCGFRAPFPTGGASDLRLPSSGRPADRTRGGRS